jgi:hypothetical protein
MRFTAVYVETSSDDKIANALFADPESNPDEPAVLSFSRAIEFADSAYYFEVNDQSYGSYEGVEKIWLTPSQLRVKVKPEVVEKFEQKDWAEITVDLELEEEQYQGVVETLQQIFAGTEVLQVA